MNYIAEFLYSILGAIMKFCYALVNNYGLSIILFTLITKVILFPVSLLVQKNSITMVKMMPEENALKIKYIDDKDKFTDERLALWKRNKYNPLLGIVPLLIQIPIVLGLMGVIYRPLSYVLNIDKGTIEALKDWLINVLNVGETSKYQLDILTRIKDGLSPDSSSLAEAVDKIFNFDANFLGFNLSLTPNFKENANLLFVPVLSGLSAWFLCFMQNKFNTLQMAQGKLNKILTTVFMVCFSTYISYIVPAGVGLYWIFGNLFAVLNLFAVNAVMPPKKYIDYEYLNEMNKKKKEKEELFSQFKSRENADYKRFFAQDDVKLVFYSEANGFYKYYAGIIDYICEHSDVKIHYITSDPYDKIFDDKREQIEKYYIGSDNKLIPLFLKLDCDICVMTMPDLEKYHIKRSKVNPNVEYVYTFHGFGSVALTLRKGALDWYDTVFCTCSDVEQEIRELEALYGTKAKTIVESGYCLFDEMNEAYIKMEHKVNDPKKILIAPSWQPDNIIDSCADQLLSELSKSSYEIILRPHPQQVRLEPEKFEQLKKKYADCSNIEIQTDFSSNNPVMESDLLITDWSCIGYEFAFTTKKPALFINTPMKIMNLEYDRIKTVPINISLREDIGASLDVDKISEVNSVIDGLFDNAEMYHEKIDKIYHDKVFAIGNSAKISAKYILYSLKNK